MSELRPMAYSFECIVKHISSVFIQLSEIQEKLDELYFEKGITLVKDIPILQQLLDDTFLYLCELQRLSILSSKSGNEESVLEKEKEIMLKIRYNIRKLRRILQSVRLKLYEIPEIDNNWLFTYFEPDMIRLIGNLNEIENHATEVISVIDKRLSERS